MDNSKLAKISLCVFVICLVPAVLLYSGTGISFLFSRMLSVIATLAFMFFVAVSIFRPTRPLHLAINILVLIPLYCVSLYTISMGVSTFSEMNNETTGGSVKVGVIEGSLDVGLKSLKGLGLIVGIGWGEGGEWNGHWVLSGIGGIFVVIGTPLVLFFVLRKQYGNPAPSKRLVPARA